jgi:asparagine synthase (glutamine-hydrolysing)
MLQGQSAYGGDEALDDDGVLAFGRTLFACLPEDAYDHGPQSRSVFRLLADVRLDNRPQLVTELGLSQTGQARMSDAALLFEALLKWGDRAVDHLVGEFAFAFWDGAKQELLLGRDIFGLRPLYYHRAANFFAFASMPSGLHALADVPYDFDRHFMIERLAMLPPAGPRSCFKGIERVEPAHVVRVTRNSIESQKYWQPAGPSGLRARPEEYEEGLRAVFDQAVAAQLRGVGDVVASQLSGGLDSSTVTATAARLFPNGKVAAFTSVPRAGFDGPTPAGTIANEADLASATARLYPNIEHVVIENSGESPLEWLDHNFRYQQQPMTNLANAVWGQAIHRAAKARGANVILKGTLGNLTVSYSGLEWLPLLLSQGRLPTLIAQATGLAREGLPLKSIAARTFGPFVPAPMWRTVRRLFGKTPGLKDYSAVNDSYRAEVQRLSAERGLELAERPRRDPFENRVWALNRSDGGNAYKGVLAEWGLSVRDPTGDRRVIEYCLSIPYEEFVRGGVPRSLARRTFSDRLPAEVVTSRVRGYQSADWYEALDRARPAIEEELASIARCVDAGDPLDLAWLGEALSSWPSDRWGEEPIRHRYRLGMLRGISAGHFMRKVRGTN